MNTYASCSGLKVNLANVAEFTFLMQGQETIIIFNRVFSGFYI